MKSRPASPRVQIGAIALLPVLVIAAIITSTLAGIFVLHEQRISTVLNTALYDQSALIGLSLEQLGQQLLSRDRAQNSWDDLGEPWAQPLVGVEIDGVVVYACLLDEQSRLNLNNFSMAANVADTENPATSPMNDALRSLAARLGVSVDLSIGVRLRDWLDQDGDVNTDGGAEDEVYMRLARPYRAANRYFSDVSEFALVSGVDSAAVETMTPWLAALPEATPVNVNTASPLLLESLLAEGGGELATNLVRNRPFRSRDALLRQLNLATDSSASGARDVRVDSALLGVASNYYLLIANLHVEGMRVEYRSHLSRGPGGDTAPWSRSITVIPAVADALDERTDGLPAECLMVSRGPLA